MQFELTEALIKDILFSMENQNGIFYLDTREGIVIPEGDEEFDGDWDAEDSRLVFLPEWDSSEGFRLMERFAAGFKNTIIRNKLAAALDRGRGVFRAFKDVMAEYPEAEQLWFAYKEREMRRIVLDWYNGLREEWGLERIGSEPEETGDLVLEDFRFRDADPKDIEKAGILHREYVKELEETLMQSVPKETARSFAVERTEGWVFPGDWAIVAETGSGEFAAYLAAEIRRDTLRVAVLEVRPEYRGLGIGEALLSRLPDRVPSGITRIILDLPSESGDFSRVLLRNAFTPYTAGYVRYM
ncbi:MAG: GNAT family N-acetyltransferase [Treponema sp.]|jgi:GNAT superfamily N-acetyltransferase|nr:GNAT family N-acetyltransferase [Treponema sp.]